MEREERLRRRELYRLRSTETPEQMEWALFITRARLLFYLIFRTRLIIFTICKWRWWCNIFVVRISVVFLATDRPKNKVSDVPCILK